MIYAANKSLIHSRFAAEDNLPEPRETGKAFHSSTTFQSRSLYEGQIFTDLVVETMLVEYHLLVVTSESPEEDRVSESRLR